MEQLFSKEINPNLDETELVAILREFQEDFNQKHFVRNDSFKKAADGITGEQRRIFIEFLERSCTAEFSGFLLYKELGRRLKKTAPVAAEIFTLMSRDEARHAGFLNKAMSDFNLALDLGFLTKNRQVSAHSRTRPGISCFSPRSTNGASTLRARGSIRLGATTDRYPPRETTGARADLSRTRVPSLSQYTFFKPKFIIYATYLSEKIGYWRYISIYRHLQANPDDQLYPIFQYFENWCQDENRHGDFFTACLKARPEFINDFESKLWARFFCLSVYVTMYLNDHSRQEFYGSLGLDTTQFNIVIHQTNKTTAQIFPQVIDTYNPKFKEHLDKLVVINTALAKAESPLEKAPLIGFASNLLAIALISFHRLWRR